MPITKLLLTNIGPFDEIEFELDEHVNVFTGPNNSGKSSSLWALADIAVYPFSLPEKLLRQGKIAEFTLDLSGLHEGRFSGRLPSTLIETKEHEDPRGYWTLEPAREHVRVLEAIGYSKFIPALRRSTDFRSPGPTVTQREDRESQRRSVSYVHEATAELPMRRSRSLEVSMREANPDLRKRLTLVSDNPSLVSDEAVIQQIIDLDYRSYLRTKSSYHDIIVKIAEMASGITDGFPIQFGGVNEDASGFYPEFSTVDGLMPLNTLSQGTQSIVQWLAHLLIGYAEYHDFPKGLGGHAGSPDRR